MQKDLKEIKPLKGLGKINFGMSRDEIKSMLGEADDIDDYSFSGGDEDRSQSWHYDELELSMSFDEDDDWRVITIAVSSGFYELEGKSLIGMGRDELMKELENLGFDDLEMEEGAGLDMPDHDLIASPSRFMNFWLQNDVLSEIQWSPEFTEGDEINWPA